MSPGPKTTQSMPAAVKSAASVQKPRSTGDAVPSTEGNFSGSRYANDGLTSARRAARAAARRARARRARRARRRGPSPAAGAAISVSVASSGMTLKATPPSSLATFMHMPRKPSGPSRACACPILRRRRRGARRRRAAPAIHRRASCGRRARRIVASIHTMPRWRVPTRHEVGSQTMARCTSASASLRARGARGSRSGALFVAGEGDARSAARAHRRARTGSRRSRPWCRGAEADDAAVADAGTERIGRPAEVDRHGVDVRVDEEARRAPGRQRVGADREPPPSPPSSSRGTSTTRTSPPRARSSSATSLHRRGSSPPGLCVSTAMRRVRRSTGSDGIGAVYCESVSARTTTDAHASPNAPVTKPAVP